MQPRGGDTGCQSAGARAGSESYLFSRQLKGALCDQPAPRPLGPHPNGDVRQVQLCKWTTTKEGSLEPLCRLTHSVIQERRC
jgi:hypothetical protein